MKKIVILFVSFFLMIAYVANAQSSRKPVVKKQGGDNTVYVAVDKIASFPGGLKSMVEYMEGELNYPEDAQSRNVQGRVMVTFVINKDGSIQDVTVQKSVDPSLDSEAIRMVKAMPKWTPAERDGKVVRSRYTLPVLFKLK